MQQLPIAVPIDAGRRSPNRHHVIIDDFMPFQPQSLIDRIRNLFDLDRAVSEQMIAFLAKCIDVQRVGMHDMQVLRLRMVNANRRRVGIDNVLEANKGSLTVDHVFLNQMYVKHDILWTPTNFLNLLETCCDDAVMTDDEWLAEIQKCSKMGIAYKAYIHEMYQRMQPIGESSCDKCAYILTANHAHIFDRNVSLRQQWRQYCVYTLYVGQGEFAEPLVKQNDMRSTTGHNQALLCRRLLLEDDRRVFYSHIAVNLHPAVAKLFEGLLQLAFEPHGLLANRINSPGKKAKNFPRGVPAETHQASLMGLLFEAFLKDRTAHYNN